MAGLGRCVTCTGRAVLSQRLFDPSDRLAGSQTRDPYATRHANFGCDTGMLISVPYPRPHIKDIVRRTLSSLIRAGTRRSIDDRTLDEAASSDWCTAPVVGLPSCRCSRASMSAPHQRLDAITCFRPARHLRQIFRNRSSAHACAHRHWPRTPPVTMRVWRSSRSISRPKLIQKYPNASPGAMTTPSLRQLLAALTLTRMTRPSTVWAIPPFAD